MTRQAAALASEPADASRVALYVRLLQIFRDRIVHGDWSMGRRLPTISELCRQYDAGRVTVRQALQLLAVEGLITSTRGKGTFVTGAVRSARDDASLRTAISDPLEVGPDQTIKVLHRRRTRGLPPELATATTAGEEYMLVRKLHLHDGRPFAFLDMYVLRSEFERFPKGAERQVKMARLLSDYGRIRIAEYRQEMTLAHADAELASHLGCPLGDVLVRLRRWRTGAGGDRKSVV